MTDLRSAALGFAVAEADHRVAEEGEDNHGPRIRRYGANAKPPFAEGAPWCALFVQYVFDLPATHLGAYNPLNDVAQEALVQSYVEWAGKHELIVSPWEVRPGDLVAYRFSASDRWNHIGIVVGPPKNDGGFTAIEGNTSPGVGATDEEREREGDGVYWKARAIGRYPVTFLAVPPR